MVELVATSPEPPDEHLGAMGERLADALNAYDDAGGADPLSDVVQTREWAEWYSQPASRTDPGPSGGPWTIVLQRGSQQVVVIGRPRRGWRVAGRSRESSSTPAVPPVGRGYKPLSTAATALRVLFAVIVVLAGVTIAFRFQERSLLNDPAGASAAEIEASDERITSAWGIYFVLVLVTSAIFVFWFHRAYRNLDAFGRAGLRYSRGWAIGSWFIPFANLVIPKLIANDLWRGSDPAEPIGAPNWRSRPVAGFVNVWWGAFVGGNLLNRYADNALANSDTINEAKTLNLVLILASACVLIGGVCAYLLVTRVTHRQERLVAARPEEALEPGPEARVAPPEEPSGEGLPKRAGDGQELRDSQPPNAHAGGARAFVVVTAVIGLILAGIAAFLFVRERTQSERTAPATTGAPVSSSLQPESADSSTPPMTTARPTTTGSSARVAASLLPPLPGYTEEDVDNLDALRSNPGIAEDLATRRGDDLLAAKSVVGNRSPVLVYVLGPRTTPGATRPLGTTCGGLDTVTLVGQIVCEQFLAPAWVLSWVAGDYTIRSAADDRLAAEEVLAALIAANGG